MNIETVTVSKTSTAVATTVIHDINSYMYKNKITQNSIFIQDVRAFIAKIFKIKLLSSEFYETYSSTVNRLPLKLHTNIHFGS